MKTFRFVHATFGLWVAIMLISVSVQANVWRVNNRSGVDADFTSIMQAHQSSLVQNGDTLYVEGSSASHGDVTLSKKLVIIGPGYFLAENPETQADHNPAVMTTLTLNPGSEGSIIKGCKMQNVIINASDIIFKSNRVKNTAVSKSVELGGNINNIIIRNNYIHQSWTAQGSKTIAAEENGTNNVLIQNNYIFMGSTLSTRFSLFLLDGFSGEIVNNMIYGNAIVNNTQFHNNIFRRGSFSADNTNITHNIANEDQFGNQNGNQQNVDMDDVFVDPNGESTDGKWQLSPASPAIGAGIGGTDIGIFGGEYPYRLSGLPRIPSIYEINHTINYEDQTLEVEFSVKSNN